MLPDSKSQGEAAVSSESFISLVKRFRSATLPGSSAASGCLQTIRTMEVKDEKHQGGDTHQVPITKHINLKAGLRDKNDQPCFKEEVTQIQCFFGSLSK